MARTAQRPVLVDDTLDNDTIPFELPANVQLRAELRVSVMGISPLLTHSALSMLEPKRTRGNTIPSPEEEAEAGCYRTADGYCALLGVMFQRTLLEAASAYKAKGRMTFQSLLAHVEVAEDLVPLVNPTTREPLTTYENIYLTTAIVQRARILRARPRFLQWAIKRITFKYDPQLIANPTVIPDILADAGTRRGVGDNRPGKSKGSFGRFAIIAVAYGNGSWQRYEPGAAIAERVDEPEDEADENA